MVLTSHGIPHEAFERLLAGDEEGFIESRQAALAKAERAFMREFGLGMASIMVGEADIDTI